MSRVLLTILSYYLLIFLNFSITRLSIITSASLIDGFASWIFHCKNSSERDLAIREGQEHLEVLKRQVVLGRLYPSATSVMETAA